MNMGIQDGKLLLNSLIIIAHLAWKLALVVKDQVVDTEALLESYTAEVNRKGSEMSKLILATLNYSQNSGDDFPISARNKSCIIDVSMGVASRCNHSSKLSMATTGNYSCRSSSLRSLRC
jgi:hypothetical protein